MVELNLGFDLAGPKQDGWLYKDRGNVCGPVSAAALIDKIFDGTLDGETPISTEFGDWQRLCEVPQFEQPLTRALKTKAEEQEKLRQARASRNRIVTRIGMLAMAAITFGTTGFFGGRYVGIERPWEDHTDWTKRPPALVVLPAMEVKKVAAEDSVLDEDEIFDDEEAGLEPPPPPERKGGAVAKRGGGRKGGKGKGGKGKTGKGKEAAESSEGGEEAPAAAAAVAAKPEYNAAGLPRTLTQKQIMKVLATQKGGIVRCLSSEAKKNPDMPPVVTIEFTIQNDGRASQFKVKERAVRDGPLADCLRSKVSACRWPKFFGEVRNVTLPFNIKRK